MPRGPPRAPRAGRVRAGRGQSQASGRSAQRAAHLASCDTSRKGDDNESTEISESPAPPPASSTHGAAVRRLAPHIAHSQRESARRRMCETDIGCHRGPRQARQLRALRQGQSGRRLALWQRGRRQFYPHGDGGKRRAKMCQGRRWGGLGGARRGGAEHGAQTGLQHAATGCHRPARNFFRRARQAMKRGAKTSARGRSDCAGRPSPKGQRSTAHSRALRAGPLASALRVAWGLG